VFDPLIPPCLGTSLRSDGNTSTSPAITPGTQIKGWLRVGSAPSEFLETASARLSVHKSPFREVLSPGTARHWLVGSSYQLRLMSALER
jgi:hypothetical protein